MAKVAAHNLRPGMVIEHNKVLWYVVVSNHVRIGGRGGACIQVELRGVEDGAKVKKRLRTDEKLERPYMTSRTMQYLYAEGDKYIFMDTESFEQQEISANLLEDLVGYLTPNLEVTVTEFDGRPLGIVLPVAVKLEVTITEPRIKGSTATSSFKPATLSTGLQVMVPAFISNGEYIKVSTVTGEYLERPK